jgi:hypothetical protein
MIMRELSVQLLNLNSEMVAIRRSNPRRALQMITLIEQVQDIIMAEMSGRDKSAPAPVHHQDERRQSSRSSETLVTPPQDSQEMLEAITNWDTLRQAKRAAAEGDISKAVNYMTALIAEFEKFRPRKACEKCGAPSLQSSGGSPSGKESPELHEMVSQMRESLKVNHNVTVKSNRVPAEDSRSTSTSSDSQASSQDGAFAFPSWSNGIPYINERYVSDGSSDGSSNGELPHNDESSESDPEPDTSVAIILEHDGRPFPCPNQANHLHNYTAVHCDEPSIWYTRVQIRLGEVHLFLPPGFSVRPGQHFRFTIHVLVEDFDHNPCEVCQGATRDTNNPDSWGWNVNIRAPWVPPPPQDPLNFDEWFASENATNLPAVPRNPLSIPERIARENAAHRPRLSSPLRLPPIQGPWDSTGASQANSEADEMSESLRDVEGRVATLGIEEIRDRAVLELQVWQPGRSVTEDETWMRRLASWRNWERRGDGDV